MPAATYPIPLVGSEVLIAQIPAEFETNEQVTAQKLPKMPFRFSLTRVQSTVKKALAGTDAGTTTIKKSSTTLATVSHLASAALNNEVESADVDTSTPVEVTDQLTITTAKSTAGGRTLVSIFGKVLPSH